MNYFKYSIFNLLMYMESNYIESYFIQRNLYNRYMDFLLNNVEPIRSTDYYRESNKDKL